MIISKKSVYLSGVSPEFESCKGELAYALTRRGWLVQRREDFYEDKISLEKLADSIRQCLTVICLVGDEFGDEPNADQVGAFCEISKGRHSYAQWEYLLGVHLGKSVHVFSPVAPCPKSDEGAELAELQAAFRSVWISQGKSAPVAFTNPATLRQEVLAIKELNPDRTAPIISQTLNLENPYVGLRKFSEADADKFFGRNHLTDKIISLVAAAPLTTVFGGSGSGKSSVIRAGVIPRFRKDNPSGKVIVFSPDTNPFHSFSNGLLKAGLSLDAAEAACYPSSEIFSVVRKASGIRRIPVPHVNDLGHHNSAEPWLVFIDQFEEVFSRATKQDAPVIFHFVNSLINLASDPKSPIRVIIAIRDDFMGCLGEFPGLSDVTDRHLIRVTPPRGEALFEIIESPAAKHGVGFEADLVTKMVGQVEAQPQGLAYLQFALHHLWETEKTGGTLQNREINRASLDKINGIEGALPGKMKSLCQGRTLAEMRRLRQLILPFIIFAETDPGLTPVTGSVSLESLKKTVGIGSNALVEQMLKEGILVESDRGYEGHPVYEFAHEVLCIAWGDLDRWIGELREAAKLRSALSVDALNWETRSAQGTSTFEDLWGEEKLQRALEYDKKLSGAKMSDFERVGGITDLERKFLTASKDRVVFVMEEWSVGVMECWSHRALELNTLQAGAETSDFARVGHSSNTPFIQPSIPPVSEKKNRPKSRGLVLALVATFCLALVALFSPPLGGISLFSINDKDQPPVSEKISLATQKLKAWITNFIAETVE